MKVAVIGGGAAGFFAAIHVKENFPHAEVCILEKSNKLLSKVKISGGGRCNVTNGENSISKLAACYPRGEKVLKKLFRTFSTTDTMRWFESRSVPLVIQEDNCVFPVSQNSQTIIDCFLREAKNKNIDILTEHCIEKIECSNGKVRLHIKNNQETLVFEKVIIATGGSPKRSGLLWLEQLGHEISEPVPSLFTFNMPTEKVRDLMGIVVENVFVRIQGSKLSATGPLLITHWGMSGPAILKLSAFGARHLHDFGYEFKVQVNWVNIINHEEVLAGLSEIAAEHANKQINNFSPYALPVRLWDFLIEKSGIPSDRKWNELGHSGLNKLTNLLTHDIYDVKGKTTFKEEFVTCGGISLNSIHHDSMRSKLHPELYFTGEVLDIDGITGGYNFQAAWTTAFIAAHLK